MRFSVLGSGSGGNSVLVESGQTSILIDAGFSGKELEKRLGLVDRTLQSIKAICLTHEHRDHISGVGVIARKYNTTVWGNEKTLQGSERIIKKIPVAREFQTGDILQLDDLEVRSFPVMHDTSDPVGYTVSDGKVTLGICTDTGHVSHLMAKRLSQCEALILEFNHDPDLLRLGPYPLRLQQRVRSRHGHLANGDSAKFLKQLCHPSLETVVLAHLSETNNSPDHALTSARETLCEEQHVDIMVASQNSPLPIIEIASR